MPPKCTKRFLQVWMTGRDQNRRHLTVSKTLLPLVTHRHIAYVILYNKPFFRFFMLIHFFWKNHAKVLCGVLFQLFLFTFHYAKIHTRLWHCGRTVTCNCGVAIRELRDVIVLTSCTEDLQYNHGMPMKVLITSPDQLMRGTQILVRHHGSYSEYVVRVNAAYMFPLTHLLMTQRIYFVKKVVVIHRSE